MTESGEQVPAAGTETTTTVPGEQKQETASNITGGKPFAIVGIGASAGGLEALEELFQQMPLHTGMAFVVVSHLHPGHKSLLPELLNRISDLPVVAAADNAKVQANHVYVGPPGMQLSIHDGRLQHHKRDKVHPPKMPINHFFRALAQDQKERAIGIILSGTLSDGAVGLQEIKAGGGIAMAQLPESARYPGMPTTAIATQMVDFILRPAEIGAQLLELVRAPYLSQARGDVLTPVIPPEPLQEMFALLFRHKGQDFSGYKNNTVYRRIARRMNVHQIHSYDDYARYLRDHPVEVDLLFSELLINVTSFFRDIQAWDALRLHLEALISSRADGSTLRVWVPGCSSGEEVFTLCILLNECIEARNRRLDVQIFGTDIDSRSIEKARTGSYPEGVVDDVPSELLEKYFTLEKGHYRIRKAIRDMAVFATQNAIDDPPFSQMDLISCRNLLIYFNADIQKRVLPLFHYALKPGGLLFLGSSEAVGFSTEQFEPLDKRWKIFGRRESVNGRQILPFAGRTPIATRERQARPAGESGTQRQIEQALLSRFAPASVIVNARGDIVHIHGHTGAYLEPSQGPPRNNILDMARVGLQLALAEAMRQCIASATEISRCNIPVISNGEKLQVDLMVMMLGQSNALRDLLLISFRPTPSAPIDAGTGQEAQQTPGDDVWSVEHMGRALGFLNDTQQATLEELNAANEALGCANEELQSTNEELQSSNEELETSKEEMQSLNEELTTVNGELQSKLDELSQAHDDMQNLLNSTKIATVFLDGDLRIKRFTEPARELVMLRQTDVGRPISELVSKVQLENLTADCRDVLRTLVFKEAEVTTSDDANYLMRIMPYRTGRNAIDGLVMTFVDITRLKHAEKQLRHMAEVFQEGADPIFIVDLKGDILDLNDQAKRIYGYSRDEIMGESVNRIFALGQPESPHSLIDRCRDGEAIRNIPVRLIDRSRVEVMIALTLTVLTTGEGKVDAIAMVSRKLDEEYDR